MNTVKKIGRISLALLLASLTCFGSVTATAFAAEQEPSNATTETNAAIENAATNAATEDAAAGATDVATGAENATTDVADEAIAEDAAVAAEDVATDAATEDAHTFNISSTLELMDAYKYDINTQSNESFVINLTADIVLNKPTDRFDTHGKRLNVGTDRLSVKHGNTVTIIGNGHTITYNDRSMNNLSLNAQGGTLILGREDGSDTLTINFDGTGEVEPLISAVQGGTAVINEGVTLSNNVNQTGLAGGGVLLQSGGTLIMNGGVIENCTNSAIPYGGGVAVDGGTFYMNGGVIKGNSEPDEAQSYHGAGGGVAVGLHDTESTFVMGGNAVIEGNTARFGGGVYVGSNGSFTMKDNAAVVNNTATEYGGGVYVEKGGTFTMGEDALVCGNDAQHGGGVLNFGTATVTNVYDNDASVAGADIYNDGTITMEDVKADWSLSREQSTSDPNYVPGTDVKTPVDDSKPDLAPIHILSLAAVEPDSTATNAADGAATTDATDAAVALNPSNKNIDGWYYDGHRETGETDENGNAVVEHNRWNANEDTPDVPQYLQSYAVTGQPTNEVMGLKAAHSPSAAEIPQTINVIWENYDGTELFTLEKVDAEHVPPATEYEALSGHENPTEAPDANNDYEFEGWDRSVEPDGDVIYTAEYEAVPHTPDSPDEPDKPTPHDDTDVPETPQDNPVAPEPTPGAPAPAPAPAPEPPAAPADEQPAVPEELPQTGDQTAGLIAGTLLVSLAAAGALGAAGYKLRKNH